MELAPLEIVRFLRENGVGNISEADCSNMISYYRGQMSVHEVLPTLGFKEFLAIVVPLEAPALKDQVQMRPRNFDPALGGCLDPRVEHALAELLEKEILYHRLLETQKQQMVSHKQFEYDLAFNEIDDWRYGYIDHKNLKSFLRKHGWVGHDADLRAIIRRIDLDGDFRIGREEFIEALMPYQPYSKALTRQQEKDRSRSHERARPGLAPPFALNMEHGLRRTGPVPEDEMGQHLIAEAEKKLLAASEVGRQFRRKPKLIVPNCAQILP